MGGRCNGINFASAPLDFRANFEKGGAGEGGYGKDRQVQGLVSSEQALLISLAKYLLSPV